MRPAQVRVPITPGGSRSAGQRIRAFSARPCLAIVLTIALACPLFAAEIKLPEPAGGLVFAQIGGDGSPVPLVIYGGDAGCRIARILEPGGAAHLEALSVGDGLPLLAPFLADGDGDGAVDLIAVQGGLVVFRKGLGGGAFTPASQRMAAGADLLLPTRGCAPAPLVLFDAFGDAAPELLLPILGGVRAVSLPGRGGADAELMLEPKLLTGERILSFASALPAVLESPSGRTLVLGPIVGSSGSRLDFAWWSRRKEDGALVGHRSAFALPADEIAVMAHLLDIEGDGRPEVAVLSMPSRLKSFLGEFRLHVFRAGDRADATIAPFYSAATNLNYWQIPVITHRAAPGGADILLAFYRGLTRAHLNIETFRSNGSGSFDPKPRDFEVATDKDAAREFLQWEDVDGDGLKDLATSAGEGVRIYRGRSDRERPVENAPTWTAPVNPQSDRLDVSISGDGRLSVSPGKGTSAFFRDVDGDGIAEVFMLGRSSIRVEPLRKVAARSGSE